MMINGKQRDKLDYLLHEFKDEYDRIDVDMSFCISMLESIKLEMGNITKKAKSWEELHGISIPKRSDY